LADTVVTSNVSYATEAEKKSISTHDKFLRLDIIRHSSLGPNSNRPVFIFIHGGAWSSGHKTTPYPLLKALAQDKWVVVSVDYRLAPVDPYPAALVDAKRALRWVKDNIKGYGGDPSFISVGGDSAGGHIAGVLALTPNEKEYQPGFEQVDTRVNACVMINAVTDLNTLAGWFATVVSGRRPGDDHTKFLQSHSPIFLVQKESVPFLTFHGESDTIVPHENAVKFTRKFEGIAPEKITSISLPRATHIYHILSCPRTHYQAFFIERWLSHAHKTGKSL